jgi:hypothetical protein
MRNFLLSAILIAMSMGGCAAMCGTTVPPGTVGILVDNMAGGDSKDAMQLIPGPDMVFVGPWHTLYDFPVSVQQYTWSASHHEGGQAMRNSNSRRWTARSFTQISESPSTSRRQRGAGVQDVSQGSGHHPQRLHPQHHPRGAERSHVAIERERRNRAEEGLHHHRSAEAHDGASRPRTAS